MNSKFNPLIMDQEEEDSLNLFKDAIVELLKDISYVGVTIKKKSNNMLRKINDTSELDSKGLETLGKGIINILKGVKDNMVAITDTFGENLEKLNKEHNEKLFTELSSKLLEYKTSKIVEGAKNEYIPTVLCDKAMQTDFLNEHNGNDHIHPKHENNESNLMGDIEDNSKVQTDPINDHTNKSSIKEEKLRRGGLSLVKKTERTDTQDTDDYWTDSLVRSLTAVDLWNKEYQGDKINATDEYLDQLKKAQEEDDQWDKETVDLNFDVDKDDSDDTFIDGRTPEERKVICKELDGDVPSDVKEIMKSETDGDVLSDDKKIMKSETDMSPKQESFVIEEHKLPDLDIDTVPNTINSKDDSVDIENSCITDKSNLQPEKLIDEGSVNLDINKEFTSPKPNPIIDYDNPIPGCSKDQSNVCSSSDKIYIESEKLLESASEVEKSKTNRSVDSDFIETDNSESAIASSLEIISSQSTDGVGSDRDELTKLDMPENTCISPYSVETVKLASDSDESPNSQNSDISEFSQLTQVISNENANNSVSKDNLKDNLINTEDALHRTSNPTQSIESLTESIPHSDMKNDRESDSCISNDRVIIPDSIQPLSVSDVEKKIPEALNKSFNSDNIETSEDLNNKSQKCNSQEETRRDDNGINSTDKVSVITPIQNNLGNEDVPMTDISDNKNLGLIISNMDEQYISSSDNDKDIVTEQQTKMNHVIASTEVENYSGKILDKTHLDCDETNMNKHIHITEQGITQVEDQDQATDKGEMPSTEKEGTLSDKSYSDYNDVGNTESDSRQVMNEQGEISTCHLEKTITQESQIPSDGQMGVIGDTHAPETESVETGIYESSELDKLPSDNDKTDTDNDDIQLTQVIDIENNSDTPKENIIQPSTTAASNTEADSQDRTDVLSPNLKKDNHVQTGRCTDTSENLQHDNDSGLICDSGDNKEEQGIEQINQKTNYSEKESCTDKMGQESGVSQSLCTSGSTEKSLSAANFDEKNQQDKINCISDDNKNKTSNLENTTSLSQCSSNTQLHGSLEELSEELISNVTENKEIELSPSQNCDTPVLGKQSQSNGETINKDDLDSLAKIGSDEEDASSSKSFEFDISACLTEIGNKERLHSDDTKMKSTISENLSKCNNGSEKIVSEEKDDKKTTEDIIEALEELLCKENKDDNQNKTVNAKSETIRHSEDCDKKDKNDKDIDKSLMADKMSEDKQGISNEIQTDKEEKNSDNSVIPNIISEDKQSIFNEMQTGIKETIEIVSDSDEDVHLDVTMEEIISSGSSINVECISDQEDIDKTEEIEEIIPTNPDHIEEENTIDGGNNKSTGLADELLELLREVEVHSELNCISKGTTTSDKTEIKKADEIFKLLQEESNSDISDEDPSNEDASLSSSDLEWIDDNSNKSNEEKKMDEAESEEILEKYTAKECYVALERLEMNEYEIVKVNKKLNDSVDRLCDINSLLRKRKFTHTLGLRKSRLKRLKTSKQGTSDSESDYESFSDFTDSETEKDKSDIDLFSTMLPAPLEQKLDDMLAKQICNVFKGNTSDESSDYDSDSSNKNIKKKEKSKRDDSKYSDSDKKEQLTKEELRRKAWKNDPLLRGKLTSSESDNNSSTSNSEKSRRRRNVLKTKYEHDTDFYLVSDSSDTDSGGSTKRKQNRVLMAEKIISPIKKNIPISDSDSTDSEIEFVPQQKTPEKSLSGDDAAPSNSQKGRRNIRALMSDESLAEATQRANKEEQERIERLEDRHRIKESFSQSFTQKDDEDDLILDVDVDTGEPAIKVHPGLTKKLKPHQKDGIQFMWDSCYESVERLKDEGSGCILAHCMGLGKTFQVLALIHTLFAHEITNTKHVLVVCPLSTVNNWKKEVKIVFKDLPEEKFNVLTIADKKETSNKYNIVKKWSLKKKCVLVLGYEGFETLTNEFKLDKGGRNLRDRMLEALVDPGPDLVICDEGHLLRNKKALKTLALNRIKTKRRIVLTGTPLQNNLLEYYYMVQFVKPNLLGNMKEFKTNFVNPITNGQYEDSTKDDIKLMMKRTHVLHKLLKKSIQRVEDTELKIYLPKIVDYAIFIQLHQVQAEMYNRFSELVQTNSTDTNRRGFLSDFVVFQYIGTHPYLLSVIDEMRNKKIKEKDLITNEQEDNPICNIDGWWKAKVPEDAAENIEYGNKLIVVKAILEECEEIGDKVLLFSQSLGELDLIEHFLKKVGTAKCASWKKKIDYFRMDGTVAPEYRSTICDLFNDKDNKKIRLLLMSTKVGGLGLNLTAANRVIIMTVNWNPSFDTQSVFRVYRFGQEKEVFVYRLISMDTMEEKVYQRTVTKLAIAHRVVDKHQITRHYKSMDLQELYSCRPNADVERTVMPNLPEDSILGKLILKLPFIFKYHEHQALLANRPEDNLNEQELNAAWDEFKKIKDAAKAVPPQMAPLIANPNGPTFDMAYALTRPTQVSTNMTAIEKENDENYLQQYFIPKPNQKNGIPTTSSVPNHLKLLSNKNTNGTNSNKSLVKPNIPPDTVITVEENPVMIPLPPSTSNTSADQDPLYIPEREIPIKTYSELLKNMMDNRQLPKVPKSTSIFLENNLPKTKSSNAANNSLSIVIDDDEIEKRLTTHKLNLLGNNTSSNANRMKRRPDEIHEDRDEVYKKMKYQINTTNTAMNASQNSINLDDDDDDVTVITDTTSDSGSLSSEIIKSLGLSGITIHKVMKDTSRNNSIITLD